MHVMVNVVLRRNVVIKKRVNVVLVQKGSERRQPQKNIKFYSDTFEKEVGCKANLFFHQTKTGF
jgi:hypothetical protein